MTVTKRFRLVPHGPKRLEYRRDIVTREITIAFDGRELYRAKEWELHEGIDIALPDESLLRVWVETGPRGATFVCMTRNGHPIPDSEGDPVRILWLTVCLFWIFAAVQVFLAGAVVLWGNPDATVYAIGAAGLALALFATFAWHRSVAATALASAILMTELLILVSSAVRKNPWSEIGRAIFGLSIAVWLFLRGINAVQEIKAHTLPIRRPPEAMPHQ